jgi:hypothetical protein
MQGALVRHLLVGHGREQRVGEAHTARRVRVGLQHPRRDRHIDLRGRRPRQRGGQLDGFAALRRERGEPVGDQRAEPGGQRLPAQQLEREERVPARRALDPA